jgi:outer membrane protein assembly factor BamB
MSGIDLKATLGPDVSRRAMLQGLGLGLAGAALAPRAARAAELVSPQPFFSYVGSSSNRAEAAGALAPGGVVVVDRVGGNTVQSSVHWIDYPSATVRWTHEGDGVETYCEPVVSGSDVYVAHKNTVLSLDSAGVVRWAESHDVVFAGQQVLAVGGGLVLFVNTDGELVALDSASGAVSWTAPLVGKDEIDGLQMPVVAGGVVVVLIHKRLHAFRVKGGHKLWHKDVGKQVVHRPTAGNGLVVFSHNHDDLTKSHLQALDLETGKEGWKTDAVDVKAALSAPCYFAGSIYYGDAKGNFVCLRVDHGKERWHQTIKGDLTHHPMVVEAGIAYLGGETSGGTIIQAVDLTNTAAEVVDYDPPFSGARIAGVESGVCFISKDDQSAGVRVVGVTLATVLGEFVAESELMAGAYTSSGAGAGTIGSAAVTPATPQWRSSLRVLDTTGASRPNTPVVIWASAPATIEVDGKAVTVSPDFQGTVSTDAAGDLSMVITADTITSPSISLWCPFMASDESMVLYPDHDTLTGLSNVSGDDLKSATTYSGDALLSMKTAAKAGDLASTVRGALGNTGASLGVTQSLLGAPGKSATRGQGKAKAKGRSRSSTSYIAFPDDTTNLVQQPRSAPTDRAYVDGSVPEWWVKVEDNVVSYQTSGPFDGFTATRKKKLTWDDFFRDVVKGTKKVAHIAWKTAKKDAKRIWNEAGDLYEFTVTTLERAASVVEAVFKAVVDDIKKVVQAISSIFDWSGIVDYHDTIRNAVHSAVTTSVKSAVTAAGTYPNQIIGEVKSDIDSFFASAHQKLGSGSTLTSTPGSGNPKTVYSTHGAKSWTKSKWGTDKVKHNVGHATRNPTFDSSGQQLGAAVEGVFGTITNQAGDLIETTFSNLQASDGDLLDIVTDPAKLATYGLSELLDVVQALVDLVLDLGELVVDVVIEQIESIITAVWDVLTTPIEIPVLSELYTLVAGKPLSLIDLLCLVIAIPGIVIKTALSSSADALGLSDEDLGLAVAYLVAGLVFTLFDPFTDIVSWEEQETPIVLAFVWAALALITTGLTIPGDVTGGNAPAIVISLLTLVPIGLTAMAGLKSAKLVDGLSDRANGFTMFGLGAFGLIFASAGAATASTTVTIGNFATVVPWLFKVLLAGDTGQPGLGVAMATIDFLGDAAVVVTEAVELLG